MIEKVAYDAQKIKAVIQIYERANPTGPDSIAASILSYKSEHEEMTRTRQVSKTGIIQQSDSGRRMKFVMPSNLYIILRKKFPTIFEADLKHFERDFPVFFKGWK